MGTRQNIKRNLSAIDRIVRQQCPQLRLSLDPKPRPGGAVRIIARHDCGRVISSDYNIPDGTSLLPETLSAPLVAAATKRGWITSS